MGRKQASKTNNNNNKERAMQESEKQKKKQQQQKQTRRRQRREEKKKEIVKKKKARVHPVFSAHRPTFVISQLSQWHNKKNACEKENRKQLEVKQRKEWRS
eukprot:TRINITY_DN1249_c0_g3_i2.p3 TRINITY_DN1249_c0_g3~~TRINITY_DN1249_c0_g3_i2.p3  ORF type:complete len:101 (+),score=9.08 TRINITY_DN1249_c0_g3_i2:766-1068(+)